MLGRLRSSKSLLEGYVVSTLQVVERFTQGLAHVLVLHGKAADDFFCVRVEDQVLLHLNFLSGAQYRFPEQLSLNLKSTELVRLRRGDVGDDVGCRRLEGEGDCKDCNSD